jgi:hypothetical protein
MILRLVLGLAGVTLLAGSLRAQDRPPAPEDTIPARVLIVAEVDQKGGRVVFEKTVYETRKVETSGKEVTHYVPVSLKFAFSLKEGKAITANGKPLKEADLWKRLEPGKPVVVMPAHIREIEDLDQPIRALFRDDTILLVGPTKPLAAAKGAPKKP